MPQAKVPKQNSRVRRGKGQLNTRSKPATRYTIGLPPPVANQVEKYAATVDASISKAIAALVRRPGKPGKAEARVLQKTQGESSQRRSKNAGSDGGRVPRFDPRPLNHAQDPMGEPPKRLGASSRSR